MHKKKRNNRPNKDSGKSATHNNPESLIVIRDAVGLVVSGIFAGIFFETDHKIIGIWFSFVGLAAASHVPFHHLATNSKSKTQFWMLYAVLMLAIAIWFSFWSYQIEYPEPKPTAHFTCFLSALNDPADDIGLTNDFLNGDAQLNSNQIPVVFMCRVEGQSKIPLSIIISNDSPKTATDVELMVSFSPLWQSMASMNWMLAGGAKEHGQIATNVFVTNDMQSFGLNISEAIHPGDSEQLPPFLISQIASNAPFAILIKYCDPDPRMQLLNFNLIFKPTNGFIVLKPFAAVANWVDFGLAQTVLPDGYAIINTNDTNGAWITPEPNKINIGRHNFAIKLALRIAWSILCAGILWVCFGWIFYQKRIPQ